MAGHLDPKEEWMKLRRRIRLEYYIGQPAVDAIAAAIGAPPAGDPGVNVDIDGDGVADVNIRAAHVEGD